MQWSVCFGERVLWKSGEKEEDNWVAGKKNLQEDVQDLGRRGKGKDPLSHGAQARAGTSGLG